MDLVCEVYPIFHRLIKERPGKRTSTNEEVTGILQYNLLQRGWEVDRQQYVDQGFQVCLKSKTHVAVWYNPEVLLAHSETTTNHEPPSKETQAPPKNKTVCVRPILNLWRPPTVLFQNDYY